MRPRSSSSGRYNNLAWGPAAGSIRQQELEDRRARRGSALGSYYAQAINKDAPHPAAARLWQEYIASPTVQNLYLQAGAFPATLAALEKSGKVDQDALDAAGGAPKDYVELTDDQVTAAAKVLAAKWSVDDGVLSSMTTASAPGAPGPAATLAPERPQPGPRGVDASLVAVPDPVPGAASASRGSASPVRRVRPAVPRRAGADRGGVRLLRRDGER